MAQIRVEALNKSFGTFHAVKTASFTVEDGQFLCLLGPSGCGKTTTLRMIAGLELPTAGTIRLGGEDVTMNRASERDIAFVFQLFALYPQYWFSAEMRGHQCGGARAACRGGRANPAYLPSARPVGVGPCRRRPSARRAWPGDRA